MSAAPDISIVIVNWNVRDFLDNSIQSIKDETRGHTFEIIVVDNNSSDDSVEMLRAKHPDVKLIVNTDNAGIARANNQGMSEARGGNVCLFNPDTLVIDGAFDKLLKFLDDNPGVSAVGPKLLLGDGCTQLSCLDRFPSLWTEFCDMSRLLLLFPNSRFFAGIRMGWWDHAETRDVEMLSTACMVMRREALEAVGGMDEGFRFMYDDMDFCLRIRRSGRRIVYYPHALVRHFKGKSSGQAAAFSRRERYKGRLLYFRKHYPAPVRLVHAAMAHTHRALTLLASKAGM